MDRKKLLVTGGAGFIGSNFIRHAIDANKIQKELGWSPRYNFEDALETTVDWYLDHMDWVNSLRSGEYRRWVEVNYGDRKRRDANARLRK